MENFRVKNTAIIYDDKGATFTLVTFDTEEQATQALEQLSTREGYKLLTGGNS